MIEPPPVVSVLTDNPTKLLITNELNDQTK